MSKIVVIGSPGAGKSSFARKLHDRWKIKVYHLDRLFWRPGWEKKPIDTRIDIIQNLVLERQWIIDGDYLNTSDLHLEEAEIIIFLGISPFVCLRRLMKRHREFGGRTRRDIAMGSKDKLTFLLLLKVLIYPFVDKRTFVQRLSNYIYNGEHKQVIWLHSTKEVEIFLARLEAQANEKNKSA
jgi:adenylate kinase family enzyme